MTWRSSSVGLSTGIIIPVSAVSSPPPATKINDLAAELTEKLERLLVKIRGLFRRNKAVNHGSNRLTRYFAVFCSLPHIPINSAVHKLYTTSRKRSHLVLNQKRRLV